MSRKPKIAVIGLKGLPAFGGAAAVGENIIEQLKGKYDFIVYAIESHADKKRKFKGFNQIVFKDIPLKKLNSLFYYIRVAFHALLIKKFDLIHLHHRDAAFIIPLLKIKYKIILTTHGMHLTEKWKKYEFFFKFQDIIFLKKANLITSVSLKDYDYVSEIIKRGKNKIFYIPNGINTSISANAKNEININKNKKTIVFAAGRIVPDKGCHILLDALEYLSDYEIDVIIIGDLVQMPKYKMKLLNKAKGKSVNFLGLIKDKEVLFKYIANADIFVYPSLLESMSMMLLEVASLKIPILCSDIRENRDLFTEDMVKFFCPNNSYELAQCIKYSFENYDKMKSMSEKTYNYLVKNFSWQKISKQYSNLYLSLLKM